MTEITPEALEALCQSVDRGEMPSFDTVSAVAGLYRTGQLILAQPSGTRKFNLGDRVTKTKGSSWTGLVVGFYSTSLTPIGYAVESENEPGSVQIYPESALDAVRGKQ